MAAGMVLADKIHEREGRWNEREGKIERGR